MKHNEEIKPIKVEIENMGWDCPLDYSTMFEEAQKALEEIQKYHNIGTLEELQDMKELRTPKKIKHKGCYDKKGVFHTWNGINGVPYDLCPNCENNLCTDGIFGRNKNQIKFCERCGQAIYWIEEGDEV